MPNFLDQLLSNFNQTGLNQYQAAKDQERFERQFALKEAAARREQEKFDLAKQDRERQQSLAATRQAKQAQALGDAVAGGQITQEQAAFLDTLNLPGDDPSGLQSKFTDILAAEAEARAPVKLGAEQRLIDPRTGQELVGARPEQFTLSPGQQRRDAAGNVIAEAPRAPQALPSELRILQELGQPLTMENVQALRRSGASQFNVGDDRKMGTVPAGMVAIEDPTTASGLRLVPIEGSKEEQERLAAQEKAAGRSESAKQSLQPIVRDISRALALSREGAGGPIQGQIGQLPGVGPLMQSGQLDRHLDSVRAGIAFGALQEMRNNSPTGGALGQVSNIELGLLKSTAGSLDPSLPEADLQRNLIDLGIQQIMTVHGSDADIDAAVQAGRLTRQQADDGKAVRDQQIADLQTGGQGSSRFAGMTTEQKRARLQELEAKARQ